MFNGLKADPIYLYTFFFTDSPYFQYLLDTLPRKESNTMWNKGEIAIIGINKV